MALVVIASTTALLANQQLAAAPKTDVVVFINGERLTGEVKGLERGILSYSTDFMGTIEIEWDKVAQLRSNQLFEIEMLDGTRAVARPAEFGETGTLLIGNAGDGSGRSVPLANTSRIYALDEGRLRDRLDGDISFGWSAAAANDVSQVSMNAGLTYRDEKRLWDLTYDGARSESDENPSAESHTVAFDQQIFLRNRWFWNGGGNFASNDELGLDLRVLVGGGIGRYFFQTPHQEFFTAVGLGASHEEFADGQTQESFEGIFQFSYDLYRFDAPEIDISTSLTVYPSLTVSGRVRTDANIQMRYEIVDDLFYRLSLQHSYDNEPQSLDAPDSDWSFVTSVGYSF